MKKLIALILPLFILSANILSSQSCDCTIDQVESNTVESCTAIIGEVDTVYTTSELRAAINLASNTNNRTILIAAGTYPVASTTSYPYITGSNIVIRSLSGNREDVIITGQGMQDVAPGTEIGFSLQGDNITIADLTIRDVGNHAISTNSDNHLIHNVKIQDTYEQMIKGTSGGDFSNNCIVQCCLFEYTAGVGPQWYIGGLDIHEGVGWTVRDNVFRNISSPSVALAEHAVHFWSNSADNIVERNKIVNCDRGVGFGLGNSPNEGGIIRNNTIYNDGSGIYDDVGIGLETSPNTQVYNNTIFIEYPNSIEYRFSATTDVLVTNNITNTNIQSRNGGQAMVSTNVTNANSDWFVAVSEGDLRLSQNIASVVDQGIDLGELVLDDLYKTLRPVGVGYDIGAFEFQDANMVDNDNDGFYEDEDCDDENADINPDAEEIANNDIDENCDGVFLIIDNDNDGYNSDEDCDDENADINPDAEEIANNDIDENCDGVFLIIDNDNDGYNSDEDCDDENADINPDAEEIANNDIDENCDGVFLIIDNDNDGYNSDEDCDDENADINPGAEEIANNDIDENCDGVFLIIDNDNDGYNSDEDCDDENADINPGAEEIANNDIDENCDGEDLVTSTKDIQNIALKIYPNPASHMVSIDIENSAIECINFYNAIGELRLVSYSLTANVEELNNGLYLVKVKQKGKSDLLAKLVVYR